MPINICVIGCGDMATQGHGPSYLLYPNVRLLACCDIDLGKAEAFQRRFGFSRAYTDYNAMLSKERPDAVCLLVNVEYICPITIDILSRGIPLFLEKPPGLNVEETRAMAQAAQIHHTLHAVGFNRRFAPLHMELKRRFAALPGAQTLRYDMFRVNRRDPDFATTAIHGIDAVRFIAGCDYAHIDFTYQPLPEFGEGVANIYLTARMDSGIAAQLTFAPLNGILVERATALALDHAILLNAPIAGSADGRGGLLHYHKNQLTATCESGDNPVVEAGFYGENAAFFDAVKTGVQPENSLDNAVQSVEVADAIRRRVPSLTL